MLLPALVVVAILRLVWTGVPGRGHAHRRGDRRYLAVAATLTTIIFLPAAWAVLAFDAGLVGLWCALRIFMLVGLAFLVGRVRGDRGSFRAPSGPRLVDAYAIRRARSPRQSRLDVPGHPLLSSGYGGRAGQLRGDPSRFHETPSAQFLMVRYDVKDEARLRHLLAGPIDRCIRERRGGRRRFFSASSPSVASTYPLAPHRSRRRWSGWAAR